MQMKRETSIVTVSQRVKSSQVVMLSNADALSAAQFFGILFRGT